MEQVGDEAGEAVGHNEQRRSEPRYWELNISLNILLSISPKKCFTGVVQKWQLRNLKYKHYLNYLQYHLITKDSAYVLFIIRVVFHH